MTAVYELINLWPLSMIELEFRNLEFCHWQGAYNLSPAATCMQWHRIPVLGYLENRVWVLCKQKIEICDITPHSGSYITNQKHLHNQNEYSKMSLLCIFYFINVETIIL
jgi:hypothetical protein